MKETREIPIDKIRFTLQDIRSIVGIIERENEEAQKLDHHSSFTVAMRSVDGIRYESDSISLFDDDSVALLKPPKSIECQFFAYQPDKSISFSVVHDGSYSDSIRITGSEQDWVHSVFVRLKESIEAATPTTVWFTQHRGLTDLIGSLGIGGIWVLIVTKFLPIIMLSPFVRPTIEPSPDTIELLETSLLIRIIMYPPFTYLLRWFAAYLFGTMVWSSISKWFYEAWPRVELDFGPEHLKTAKNRRKRVQFFFVSIVLPLCIAIISELFL